MSDAAAVTDSLRHVIEHKDSLLAIALAAPEPLDVLEKLNRFYTGAWAQLVIYVTVALALVGIVFPVATQIVQRQLLKTDERRLKDELSQHVDALGKAIEAQTRDEATKAVNEAIARIEARMSDVSSGIYTVQGNAQYKQGRPAEAANSFATALIHALDAQRIDLAHGCLGNLCMVLKQLTPEQAAQPELQKLLTRAIARTREKNVDGRFKLFLKELEPEARRLSLG